MAAIPTVKRPRQIACQSCGYTAPAPAFIRSTPLHEAGEGYRAIVVCAVREVCRRRSQAAENSLFGARRAARYAGAILAAAAAAPGTRHEAVVARQAKVAELAAQHLPTGVIAERLGMPAHQVTRDLKNVRSQQTQTAATPTGVAA